MPLIFTAVTNLYAALAYTKCLGEDFPLFLASFEYRSLWTLVSLVPPFIACVNSISDIVADQRKLNVAAVVFGCASLAVSLWQALGAEREAWRLEARRRELAK